MKLPLINRRNFFQFLFSAFVVSSCKKNEPVKPITQSTAPSTNPPVTNPTPSADYLGTYTTTETGGTLAATPDFTTEIRCYTDKISYNPGDLVSLYISGPESTNRSITMKDANQNVILSVNAALGAQQINNNKPWVNGFGFDKTASVQLPANLKSGVYKWILNTAIVVKSTAPAHDITIIYPSNTDNAYSFAGGKSLYGPSNIDDRTTVASFLRAPYGVDDYTSSFFAWMNTQSYDVNYIADADLDDYTQIQNSKIVIITGHSEYWTRQARENIDKFVASGKNVLVLAGNVMWWQVRYNLNEKLMICYRTNELDPLANTPYSTVLWPTPFLNYPTIGSVGADFNHGGYGDQLPNRWNGYKIVEENSPLFAGTGLSNGDILSVPTHEYDGAPVTKRILPGSSEIPVIDNSILNFYKVELLGYDFAIDGDAHGFGTFMVFQKTASSGVVVNVATENWCSPTGFGGSDKTKIEAITKNMIDLSLSNGSLFANA